MRTIRYLIRITNLDGVTSFSAATKRGAWIGLQWGHFFGVIVFGIIPCAVLTVSVGMLAYWGKLSRFGEQGVPWELLGGLIGGYLVTCGWGIIIAVILAVIRYATRRTESSTAASE